MPRLTKASLYFFGTCRALTLSRKEADESADESTDIAAQKLILYICNPPTCLRSAYISVYTVYIYINK